MNFPKYATYNGNDLLSKFKKGEMLQFVRFHEKPSSKALGNAFYKSINSKGWAEELINIKDLKIIKIELDGEMLFDDETGEDICKISGM